MIFIRLVYIVLYKLRDFAYPAPDIHFLNHWFAVRTEKKQRKPHHMRN